MRWWWVWVVTLTLGGCAEPQRPPPGPPTVWVPPPGAGSAFGGPLPAHPHIQPAPPQPGPPRPDTASSIEEAKAAHRRAAEAYSGGDFPTARAHWEDAYRLDPSAHAILINILNAAEKEGDLPAACHAYARAQRSPLPDSTKQMLHQKMGNRCYGIAP